MSESLATHLVTLNDASGRDRAIADMKRAAPATVIVGPVLPGAINGGDVLLHGDAAALPSAPAGSAVESVHYRPGETGRRTTSTEGGVYRTLLLGVRDDVDDTVLRRFEQDLLTMPEHVTSMLWWRLSRVDSVSGPTPFTHVWEQVFTDADALRGQYMQHPVHWGLVDRWFDPEVPEHIVVDRLCHTACALPSH